MIELMAREEVPMMVSYWGSRKVMKLLEILMHWMLDRRI